MLEREEGLVCAPNLSNGIAAPEPSSGQLMLPQQGGWESGQRVLLDNNGVMFKKRDVSAVRKWPPGCGRNVERIKTRRQEEKETLVGDTLDPSVSPNNGVSLSIPGDAEQPGSLQAYLIKQHVFSSPSISGKVSQASAFKEWPHRSITAVREWPLHCGRNVPHLSREECLQYLAERKKSLDGQKAMVHNKLSDNIIPSKYNDDNSDGSRLAKTMNNVQVGDVRRDMLNSGNVNGAIEKSQVKQEDLSDNIIPSKYNNDNSDGSRLAEIVNNVQVGDAQIDKLNSGNVNGATEKSQEKQEDVIRSPQPMAKSDMSKKMVDKGDERLEVKVDKGKKMLVEADNMGNVQVGDAPIDKLNCATEKSREERDDVIGSPQPVSDTHMPKKMVDIVDGRLEVKVDKKSKKVLVEVGGQVEARAIDQMKPSQCNDQSEKSNKTVNDAREQMLEKDANKKATSYSKATFQSSEISDDSDSRPLEVKINKRKQKRVEVGKQSQVRASIEAQLPQLEVECQRETGSRVSDKMLIEAADHSKWSRLISKLKPSKKICVDDIRSPKTKVTSLQKNDSFFQEEELVSSESSQDKEVILALKAAPNCPWQQGKRCATPIMDWVSHSADKKGKRTSATHFLNEDEEDHESQSSAQEVRSLSLAFDPSGNPTTEFESEDSQPEYMEDDEGTRHLQECHELNVSIIPFGTSDMGSKVNNQKGIVTRKTVRETLRLFQACCRKLLQEAEAKDKRNSNKRVDLHAYEILKQKNKFVNTGKPILGIVPGVEVGDEFHYRSELCIIGLHRQTMAGIDCLQGARYLATSIVSSGKYDDQIDDSDVLIYTGQGGRPSAKKTDGEDQKLTRGNLALKNSMEAQTPVRLIRGIKETQYKDKKQGVVTTYIYYGLYLVEKYWSEKGRHGLEFKFQLRRIPGQPNLAVREVKKLTKSKAREGICVVDISGGNEKLPICAVNTIDNEKPPPFKYITKMMYPTWYTLVPPDSCSCTNGCSDSENCICAVKNGGEIPYNYNGSIVQAKPIVYECGPSCRCRPSCHNRVSQHGIKFQLEVFKTENRGWGVRSLTSIPSGSFICEYIGEVLLDTEAEQRTGNDEYLFDIGHNYNDEFLHGDLSTVIPNQQTNSICEIVEDSGFTIDAATYGNVGRFVNHSCSPNLYAQNVFYDHEDKRLPHIMLFAAENIPPLQELTYHYNYTLDQVRDSNGNVKKKECCCGSLECTGRLY